MDIVYWGKGLCNEHNDTVTTSGVPGYLITAHLCIFQAQLFSRFSVQYSNFKSPERVESHKLLMLVYFFPRSFLWNNKRLLCYDCWNKLNYCIKMHFSGRHAGIYGWIALCCSEAMRALVLISTVALLYHKDPRVTSRHVLPASSRRGN